MKKNSFSTCEILFLIYHSICFTAALFFLLTGHSGLCLLFILLLALQVPFLLYGRVCSGYPAKAPAPEDIDPVPIAEAGSCPAVPEPAPCALNASANPPFPSDDRKEALYGEHGILPPAGNEEPVILEIITFCETLMQEFSVRYKLYPAQAAILTEEKSILLSVRKTLFTVLLNNLLDNAFKYVKADSYHLSRFTLTLSAAGPDVLIIFRNHTRGVPQEEIPFLTGLNYQGSNKISGSGLGLYQAKAAAGALNGRMWIKSSPETGFAVYLQLPGLTACSCQEASGLIQGGMS